MDSEAEKIRWEKIEKRLSHLEALSHPSVNWERKIRSVEDAYNRLYDLIKNKIGDK
jgi:predicted transcriptional regulator